MTFDFEPTTARARQTWGSAARFKRLTSSLAGILFAAMLLGSVQASVPLPVLPPTYSLTLEWNPSTSPEITGHHIYYGTASGDYTSDLLLGNVTTTVISGLTYGVTYYFAITASDADGVESVFSNEISYMAQLPGAQMQSRGLSGGQFMLTVTGPAGQMYELEATQDLITWTVIGTGTMDAGGSLDFTDPDAASHQQRFYRTREIP